MSPEKRAEKMLKQEFAKRKRQIERENADVLRLLGTNGPMTSHEISAQGHFSRAGYVRTRLLTLMNQGLVAQRESGEWVLAAGQGVKPAAPGRPT